MSGRPSSAALRRLFARRLWDPAATALICVGVVMLVQPFSLDLYGWSFSVILVGTLLSTVTAKFPEA